MKALRLPILAFTLVAVALVACSGDDEPEPTPTASPALEPSVAEFVADPPPRTIRPVVYLDAPASQPLIDGEFAVTVNIREVRDLFCCSFVIKTGSSDLKILDVRHGDFLGNSGREMSCIPAPLYGTALSCVPGGEGPRAAASGSGILAHLTLLAHGAGDFEIQFVEVRTRGTEPGIASTNSAVDAVGGTVSVK
jgi:hypothetical protein